jgi:hypothetical protein
MLELLGLLVVLFFGLCLLCFVLAIVGEAGAYLVLILLWPLAIYRSRQSHEHKPLPEPICACLGSYVADCCVLHHKPILSDIMPKNCVQLPLSI